MSSYYPILLCNAVVKIMLHSSSGTKPKFAVECVGFQKVNEDYGKYRERIERQQNRLITSNPSDMVVVVHEGSVVSASTLIVSTDTDASISVVYFVDLLMRIITFISFAL